MKTLRRSLFLFSSWLMAGCGGALSEDEPLGTRTHGLVGELVVDVSDDFENQRSELHPFLDMGGTRVPLVLSGLDVTELELGAKVRVTGRQLDNGALEVGGEDLSVLRPSGAVQALAAAETPKKVAVILFNFSNNATQPFTTTQVATRVFTELTSVNAYYREVSYGARSLEGKVNLTGDVYGWFTIAATNAGCEYEQWGSAARTLAISSGVDLSGYDYVVHVFPRASSCGFAGVATVPGRHSWINGIPSTSVIAHELGHSFGLFHANSYRCGDAGGAAVAISDACRAFEYADPFDVMGGNGHLSAFNRARQRWLTDGENIVTVTADGGFSLAPLHEHTGRLQVLRIPRRRAPSGAIIQYYYLEYRQPSGLFDRFGAADPVVNGITVRLAPDFNRGGPTLLVDTEPRTQSFRDAPLTVGRTFQDPALSLTVTTLNTSASEAQVWISFTGAAPPSNPLPGPTSEPKRPETPSTPDPKETTAEPGAPSPREERPEAEDSKTPKDEDLDAKATARGGCATGTTLSPHWLWLAAALGRFRRRTTPRA